MFEATRFGALRDVPPSAHGPSLSSRSSTAAEGDHDRDRRATSEPRIWS